LSSKLECISRITLLLKVHYKFCRQFEESIRFPVVAIMWVHLGPMGLSGKQKYTIARTAILDYCKHSFG
jgi:hypothetical protein